MRYELVLSVRAALADDGGGHYSRRERQGTSGGGFPAGRSRAPNEDTPAATHLGRVGPVTIMTAHEHLRTRPETPS